MADRTCSDCTNAITAASKTGRCRSCAARENHRDPAFRARLNAAVRKGKQTPEHRAKAKAISLKREAERRNDPEWRAYKRAAGLKLRAIYEAMPEAQAANLGRRAAVGKKLSFRRLGWLPDAHRARYQNLRSRYGAPEARRRILTEFSPFERQMEQAFRVGIVEKQDFRKVGPSYTLGGVAPEAM